VTVVDNLYQPPVLRKTGLDVLIGLVVFPFVFILIEEILGCGRSLRIGNHRSLLDCRRKKTSASEIAREAKLKT
jgi:hypothetical protein